ncbi:MAG: tRNA (guanosine(46)-N7)-methyltransferase TrmB [Calditrichia bacterium]
MIFNWNSAVHSFIQPQYQETFPIPFFDLNPNCNKLIIEIGFGNGEFLESLARENSDALCVGFDISLESCERAVKRAGIHQLNNMKVILGDAGVLMRELFAENSVSGVFMNFPDPWPKKRHKEKRLIQESFIETLANILQPGAFYELVTDQEFYAEEAKAIFDQSAYFEIEAYQKNPVRTIQTKYERKWLKLNRNIYRLKVKKMMHCEIQRIFEGDLMPHVKIRKEINPENIISDLLGKEFRKNSILFKIMQMYRADEGNTILLRTVSADDQFNQRFYIKIAKRDEGWMVKLDETTLPFRTPAVKYAVFELGRILERSEA